jgi:hypothetical protein
LERRTVVLRLYPGNQPPLPLSHSSSCIGKQ